MPTRLRRKKKKRKKQRRKMPMKSQRGMFYADLPCGELLAQLCQSTWLKSGRHLPRQPEGRNLQARP